MTQSLNESDLYPWYLTCCDRGTCTNGYPQLSHCDRCGQPVILRSMVSPELCPRHAAQHQMGFTASRQRAASLGTTISFGRHRQLDHVQRAHVYALRKWPA